MQQSIYIDIWFSETPGYFFSMSHLFPLLGPAINFSLFRKKKKKWPDSLNFNLTHTAVANGWQHVIFSQVIKDLGIEQIFGATRNGNINCRPRLPWLPLNIIVVSAWDLKITCNEFNSIYLICELSELIQVMLFAFSEPLNIMKECFCNT